jgi:hypothetical protein
MEGSKASIALLGIAARSDVDKRSSDMACRVQNGPKEGVSLRRVIVLIAAISFALLPVAANAQTAEEIGAAVDDLVAAVGELEGLIEAGDADAGELAAAAAAVRVAHEALDALADLDSVADLGTALDALDLAIEGGDADEIAAAGAAVSAAAAAVAAEAEGEGEGEEAPEGGVSTGAGGTAGTSPLPLVLLGLGVTAAAAFAYTRTRQPSRN